MIAVFLYLLGILAALVLVSVLLLRAIRAERARDDEMTGKRHEHRSR